ncbi:MAG TPA: bifunctional acetate--CoA ligase family protein/GNAT family N-acetyltransferase [Alphaproteobacteria bacterium]|nr:bifunctional acetate--CoA ligase family protein/GNAT family N-acetyltransferase [Alphaproteobacteria bacterium]
MSIRNLDAIFKPKAVALIGASPRPHAVGFVTAENLLAGGFEGPIMPVNPKHRAVGGVLTYPDVKSLPVTPDLAVICTPPATVPGLIAELGARGTRGAVVITAGFRELGSAEGKALEKAMLEAAQPHLLRIVGPNCVGLISTPIGLNASFAHMTARKGNVAFVAQSGAMVVTILDWAASRGLGFSHLVSLGDMTDVDFGDMLDFLANDPNTSAILLYIEAVTNAHKFMSAARAASRVKPVIAIKAGRHAAAARAATSHTGALAGVDAVYDAAFRRAGILRVQALDELFDAVETLATPLAIAGDRLAILTNGGGVGVLATDALLDGGGRLAELSPETIARLDKVLPRTWSRNNPVDIIGDAPGTRYADAMAPLLEAPEVDAVLVLNCPTAVASGVEAAQSVVAAASRRIILTTWLGSGAAVEARRLFSQAGIPTYETPDEAIRGFMHLVRYRRSQETLLQVPPSSAPEVTPDAPRARRVVEAAIAAGRTWLAEPDVREVLSCYGIPVAKSALAATPAEAAAQASAIGGLVALKIFSRDITHKSDVGGVALDIDPRDVAAAAEAMQARVAKAAPDARLDGFTVQQMIHRPGAYELIVGMAVDVQFGPFLLFGHGGTAVEVIADKALALPPLNLALAHELMAGTRVFRQLKGYRDRPPAALDAIALTLVQVSQMISDLDAILELDINPLLADAAGVIAVDARIRVGRVGEAGRPGGRLAISPYPRELERKLAVAGLGDALIRPIRPEDAPGLVRLFNRLSREDVRMRFFAPIHELSPRQLLRFTQIDYDREMALVLEIPDGKTGGEIVAVVRLSADPDNRQAEFAALVRSDLQGKGVGRLMMERLVDYARRRGLGEMFGDILEDNRRMRTLCQSLGFDVAAQGPGVVRATLKL